MGEEKKGSGTEAPSALASEKEAIARTVHCLNPNDAEVVDDYLHGRHHRQGRRSTYGLNKRKKGLVVT